MSSALTPACKVAIGGAALKGQAASALVSIVACQDVAAPGWFELRMSNRPMPGINPLLSDDSRFKVGNSVEIKMGYEDKERRPKRVLAGEITGLELDFHSGQEMLTVRGHDLGHRLQRGRKTQTFTQAKDSDIARKIATAAKLKSQAVDTKVTHDYVLQHNQTDWDFLKLRACNLGYEVLVEDRTLIFRPPGIGAPSLLTLARESSKGTAKLLEFRPRLSAVGLAGEVVVQGWDPKQKQPIVGRASSADLEGKMGGSQWGLDVAAAVFRSKADASRPAATLVDWPVFSPAEAQQIARGRLSTMALSYVTGDGVAMGDPLLKAGMVVKIDGFGKRFSGLYYLASVRHTYSPSRGYRTAFSVRRNAT